jgi:cytidylate kinase
MRWQSCAGKDKGDKHMAKYYSIAIDGPAGAGKSTMAKTLAKELGFYYVDTGAIYRTVAYFMDLLGVSPKDVDGVERYIDELTIEIEYDEEGTQHMIMNGMDVSGDIRTQDISQKASLVSAHAVVRDVMLDMQRNVAKKNNVIMDGRDIGTVVLPRANVKIFLTASVEVRAKRRYDELVAKGTKADLNKIQEEIRQRDHQDITRPIAPLKQARDAILVDTSNMTINEVVTALLRIIKEKIPV